MCTTSQEIAGSFARCSLMLQASSTKCIGKWAHGRGLMEVHSCSHGSHIHDTCTCMHMHTHVCTCTHMAYTWHMHGYPCICMAHEWIECIRMHHACTWLHHAHASCTCMHHTKCSRMQHVPMHATCTEFAYSDWLSNALSYKARST